MPGRGKKGVQRGELMIHLDDLREEILGRERDLERRYEQLKSDVAESGRRPSAAAS